MSNSSSLSRNLGFSIIELLVALVVGAAILAPLMNVLFTMLRAQDEITERTETVVAANFAMQAIVKAIQTSPQVLIPMVENPASPETESDIDPGVIAVRLDPELDLDLDGFADADNDRDGRVDEDYPGDAGNDGVPGIKGIDDDNSGVTDISFAGAGDDDETGFFGGSGEDPINGVDDDGDQSIDEDPPADMNGDGEPGIAGVDDDGDGSIDEGSANDDDEDGTADEDWMDVKVFYLTTKDLIERHPNLNPVDGNDFTEHVIASNVTAFHVQRLPRGNNRNDLFLIELTIGEGDNAVALQTTVRSQN